MGTVHIIICNPIGGEKMVYKFIADETRWVGGQWGILM